MLKLIIKFIVSAIVLLVVSWILPGLSVAGFTGALIAAAIIALLGWAVEKMLGEKASPQARGLTGFITAAIVIYISQFIAAGSISVSLVGALLASFVIGLVDAVIPTQLR